MKASQFFKRSPLYDSYELIRDEQCARCGERYGRHAEACPEPLMQEIARELVNESPERMRREKGEQ